MSGSVSFYHVKDGSDESLTVFIPGEAPTPISGDHPGFEDILEELTCGTPDVDRIRDLADASRAVGNYLEPLSERVSVGNGRVYFDGDEVDSVLTDHILRMLDDGDEAGWSGLVRFMENLAANPVPHSQHRLYGWLAARDFTVTEDGCFIAYKGVRRDSQGVGRSLHAGPAIVDGVEVNGHVPNEVGSVVEMSRSTVEHNPSVGCSTGLHAGTYDYAQSYGDVLLTVKVNPRDVVSVPTDSGDAKVRTCRYEILAISGDSPLASPTVATSAVSQLGG
jgi:hypothetical protein